MRHLFGREHKEAKSLKLVKKLQQEEEEKWKEELARRREQELKDEEMARKLQEEFEAEQRQSSASQGVDPDSPVVTASPVAGSSGVSSPTPSPNPPPLPSKPAAYHPSTYRYNVSLTCIDRHLQLRLV